MKKAYRFEISGLVQGVGFRPFVYGIALREGLTGEIYNDDEGVKLTLYGQTDALLRFEKALFDELPQLARIDKFAKFEVLPDDASLNQISVKNLPAQEPNLAHTAKNQSSIKLDPRFYELKIIASKSATKHAPILPDYALCADCEREFNDPNDPRYHYTFINCTNCGPRFSIIKALPYDRSNTTMQRFKMCPQCMSEYKNPLDRRYHAQPISCPNCGPSLSLKDKNGKILSKGDESVKIAANLIKDGKILAVKGLGGFHLVCDASNEDVVRELRVRKNRPKKPFAIMCKNLASASEIAEISEREEQILTSNLKPIVVLKSRETSLKNSQDKFSQIAPSVAPNLNKIGIFLPYTGLHLLLFENLNTPIVATSANVSGEPIIYDEKNLREKLGGVIDFYLDHDRDIHSPSDDSIVFIANNEPIFIRTSRGVNPKFIHTKFKSDKTILAVGAELKNQFAIFKEDQIMISPYVGDLKNIATFERFCDLIALFEGTYELNFTHMVVDLHPHFLNLDWANKKATQNGAQIMQIQHHYAHLLSVIFEHDLDPQSEYLGFCFDGTGYGTDGKIWGGEIMRVQKERFVRVAHFDEFGLIGGESSIKNIWQIAYSIILKYDLCDTTKEFLSRFDTSKLENLKKLHERNLSVVKTSSLGRIFDAFGSVILGINTISYEGEAGMELEALYDENLDVAYEFKLENETINFKNAFTSALKDEPKFAATAFINGLANLIAQISKRENLAVLLAGGVFQNRILLEKTADKLNEFGIKYYYNKQFCSNDSSIALGQLFYALLKLKII